MSTYLYREDFLFWCEKLHIPYSLLGFIKCFFSYPEYRKLIDYRLKCDGGWISIFRLVTFFSTLHINLYISSYGGKPGVKSDISGGLFFQHGFSTIIFARKIGRHCCINQQVTIGYSEGKGIPTLGDNVCVCAGAKILGDVVVGDDVIVGANAVVVKDVPSHCIVAGIPAVVIKRRNTRGEWIRVES